jgi:hypothetical protein
MILTDIDIVRILALVKDSLQMSISYLKFILISLLLED